MGTVQEGFFRVASPDGGIIRDQAGAPPVKRVAGRRKARQKREKGLVIPDHPLILITDPRCGRHDELRLRETLCQG